MKIDRLNSYYSNQIKYDLYLKFYFKNIYEIPKIVNINISIKKLKYKSKIIFIFLFYLVLILNQIFNLKFVSNKNLKSNSNKQNFNLLINLNKNNNNIFLDNLINFYLPNIKNFKILSKNTLINGNLNFKINNLFDIIKFKFNSLFNDQIFIINIQTTSLNNFLSYSLLSLYLLPIKY